MLELYQNIKARRIELGLSQTQLAELTGYADKSAISKIEKGMRDIPQSKLMAFAVALKVYTNLTDQDICTEEVRKIINKTRPLQGD